MTVALIAAMSEDRVIGRDNQIPWHYPADLKRFRTLTTGHTVIMGRRTFASIGGRALPNRLNIVLTRGTPPGPDRPNLLFRSALNAALLDAQGTAWIIGGRDVYEAALPIADQIDLTLVPDRPDPASAVLFPEIDPATFSECARFPHPEDARLSVVQYARTA